MDINLIFRFLRDIAAHNDREWFHAHRAYYEEARASFEELTAMVIARIGAWDESVRLLTPRDCTYRIYRDTRFTTDKSPYKTHFGMFINARGKNSDHCGYYLHLQPEQSLFAGGNYCPPPALLRAIRQAVYDNMDEFRSIVEDPEFTQYFPTMGADLLKTAPKGFAKDYPFLKYLQPRTYEVCHYVDDDFFLAPDFLDKAEPIFQQMRRFNDFLNYTIDDFIDESE